MLSYTKYIKFILGVTGSIIKLDKYGDSEGNFSVLSFKPYDIKVDKFECDHHMIPIGQFYYTQKEDDFPVSELFILSCEAI